MLPVLATSNFLDGVQCLLSGIARGCGWQKLCAFVNLGAFYGVHEDLDLELEEILMSVAIWRSIQDLGQPCESSSTVGCRSSGHVSNLCGLSPAFVDDRDIPSADSIKAGLAVAVAKENPGLGSVFDADRVLVSEVVNVECCSSSSIHTLSNGSGDSSHGFNDGADSSRSHLSPPTVVRPVMMAPNWTCLWRSSASLRHGSVAVLRAGEDIITVIWGLNGTTHRGVDSQYKKVKVETIENRVHVIVDVRDVADALLLAYEKPQASGRYICGPHLVRARDLVSKLNSMYPDYNCPKNFVEVSEEVKISSEKLKELGWRCRFLEETLAETYEYVTKEDSLLKKDYTASDSSFVYEYVLHWNILWVCDR
ncbi:hypothetical protein ACLOJK_035615 [Asimina triloba]